MQGKILGTHYGYLTHNSKRMVRMSVCLVDGQIQFVPVSKPQD